MTDQVAHQGCVLQRFCAATVRENCSAALKTGHSGLVSWVTSKAGKRLPRRAVPQSSMWPLTIVLRQIIPNAFLSSRKVPILCQSHFLPRRATLPSSSPVLRDLCALSRNFAKTWHGRPARAWGTAKMAVARRAKHMFPPTVDPPVPGRHSVVISFLVCGQQPRDENLRPRVL
jgi:hypothetical protein